MDFQRFLRELKERHLVRVAGVYTVTAWGLFQVAKTVFETFSLPKYLPALTLLLLALGLPVTVVAYWAVTRRQARLAAQKALAESGEAPPPRPAEKWIDRAVAAVVVVVAAVTVTTMAGLIANLRGDGDAGLTLGPANKSVAVLPFANFSSASDAEYFADGLTEEVTNTLAEIPELKVAGRTSAFYFKGKNEDLREIGRKLNVAHVLEGSVRRSGQRLRITCQLVSVKDGFHVWSETYDRTMDDAFAIQTEIADGVADALKVELKADDESRQDLERDPDAYRLQVVATGLIRRKGKAQMQSAQSILKQLIEKEPENADVRAQYAYATAYLAQNHLENDFLPAVRDAEAEIAKALELDPKSSKAYLARGIVNAIRFIREGRLASEEAAETAYRRATELAPRDPEALSVYGAFVAVRRPHEGLPYLRKALEVDPLDRVANNAFAGALMNTGRTAEAEQRYLANIELFPDYVDSKQELGDLLVEVGRLDEAVKWYTAAAEPMTDPSASISLANVYYSLGMPAEAEAALKPWDTHPLMAELNKAIKLIVARRYADLQTFLEVKMAEPEPDPVWRTGLALTGVMLGKYDQAREQYVIASPEFFQPEPKVTRGVIHDGVLAAYALEKTGDKGQSKRLLGAILAQSEPIPGRRFSNETRVARVQALAMLGDRTRALAELRALVKSGYRQINDIDAFVRLDEYPMGDLKGDARFRALIREIDADNARMRARLRAAEARPAPAKAA